MTHPLTMAHRVVPLDTFDLSDARAECSNEATPGQWLRSLASNLALVASWRVALGVLAHLLVHVADIVHHLRHGRTAVLSPSRTGGADHSAKAIMAGRAPMLFGGEFTTGAECIRRPTRERAPAVRVVVTWSAPRRRVIHTHAGRPRSA